MSPEAQRIAIAEACGWKWWTGQWGNNPTPEFRFLSPTGAYNDGYLWGNSAEPEDMALPVMHGPDLPDYLNDLNAMHEAEGVLDATNWGPSCGDCLRYAYARELYRLVHELVQPFRATAAQRAEAFLRTLGKWKESQ